MYLYLRVHSPVDSLTRSPTHSLIESLMNRQCRTLGTGYHVNSLTCRHRLRRGNHFMPVVFEEVGFRLQKLSVSKIIIQYNFHNR